jgi:two-component system, chemotaxis family, sensor kinase CheA
VFRCAHTLKGNAESIGCDAIADCSHSLENVLDAIRRRSVPVTAQLVSTLLEAVDSIRTMLRELARGASPDVARYKPVMHRLGLAAIGNSESSATQIDRPEPRFESDARFGSKTLRVNLEQIEKLLSLTGELSTSLTQLRAATDEQRVGTRLLDRLVDSEKLFGQLREGVMRLRLVPIGRTFRAQVRAVRDLAQSHGKLGRLVIEGEGVEVDTAIAEGLRDPVTHMIRNAIDHGLEPPSLRVKLGKDPVGTITLGAQHKKGRVVVWIRDDGAGFDRDRILERARSLGMVGAEQTLDDQDAFALVFASGFTTKEGVTDLSGRGVGMDVVRRNVAALKGTIAIESEKGRGATITISVPLTLAIIEGFAVSAGDERYVLPLDSVAECVELDPSEIRPSGVLNLRGAPVPYLRLREMFALEGQRPLRESVVVVEHDGGRAGLAVDSLQGQVEAVVKPLGALLNGLGMVTGSTILGDGRVAFILDVPSVVNEAEKRQKRLEPSSSSAVSPTCP